LLTITTHYKGGYGVQFYTSIMNQYSPLMVNATSYGVYAGYSSFWNQYSSASIMSNYACVYIAGKEFTWNQFGSATLWETGTWNQQGNLTINSPASTDGTPGVCSDYAIYFYMDTEWIQNGSATIMGSYCDYGIYS